MSTCRRNAASASPLAGQESDIYGLALSLCSHLSNLDPSKEEADTTVEDWVETSLRSRIGAWPAEDCRRLRVLAE